MKKHILLISFIFLAAASGSAQSLDQMCDRSYNGLFDKNFLDLSRLTMKQSFSMSYLSTGRGGLVSNLYRNSMNYRLTDKLELNLDLAYRFTPDRFNSLASNQNGGSGQGLFLPSFGMKYQPSKNFMIEFQYNQADIYSTGGSSWIRRY